MPQKLHHQKAKAWCLLSLSGMAISAALFMNEGQAGIWPAPQSTHPINLQSTNGIMTTQPGITGLKNDRISPVKALLSHPELVAVESHDEERLNKKKFGLAILFLGALAEKS